MLTFEDVKEMDDMAADGLYCVESENLDLDYSLHALSNYMHERGISSATKDVIEQAKKDGAI